MENNFDLLVREFVESPLSTDILRQITSILEKQTDQTLSTFISQSFEVLIILEHWTWQSLSNDSHQSIDSHFFHTLSSFNFLLIFHTNDLDADIRSKLLIPSNTRILDQIFEQINHIIDDNDPFLLIISKWFDNLAYLIHEHVQLETSPILIHLCEYIGKHYILNKQYKFYLTQLSYSHVPQIIFTSKQLFYMKTCSFLFRMYICSKADKTSFENDQILDQYGNDYLQIILAHHHTVQSWSKELLTCITYLICFMCACCWWGTDRAIFIDKLVLSEQFFYDFIQALIHILEYETFHERILSKWSNNETILIDSTCIFLIGAVFQMKNLSCFLRSETNLSNIILEIARKSTYDRISICAYGILAEILSDVQLREVKITENISEFFFHVLELAWNHPSKRHKSLPIQQLLIGFLTISKNDAIQQKTIRSNKLPLLIEMSDQYPIVWNILWSLSFNQEIQNQLRANRTFMTKLNVLKQECRDEKMRKTIFGILWNLEENRLERIISETTRFDIMISYSHKDEMVCKQIYEELVKAGYRVWIDFDQMHGNVMDAMAQAIERSNTIIICMSEQYRRSNYCRAEAHYAFQRQLKIVPILIQEHYRPDGWLLFLIGQLLYVNFTKYEFPTAIEKLIEELKSPVVPNTSVPSVQPQSSPSSVEILTLPENILDWTQEHVHSWLISNNLRQIARLLIKYDGPSLYSLGELIADNEPKEILTLFQEDSRQRIHENISLLELASFRALLKAKQAPTETNGHFLHFLSSCRIM